MLLSRQKDMATVHSSSPVAETLFPICCRITKFITSGFTTWVFTPHTSPPAVNDHVYRTTSNSFNSILSGRFFSFKRTLSFRATSVKEKKKQIQMEG